MSKKLYMASLFLMVSLFSGCSEDESSSSSDKLVVYSDTGLTWQDSEDNRNTNNRGKYFLNWEDANKYCSELEYADKTDWYLPSILQFETILDTTKAPSIKDDFKYHESSYVMYWSVDTSLTNQEKKWLFYFDSYRQNNFEANVNDNHNVRCVRSENNFDSTHYGLWTYVDDGESISIDKDSKLNRYVKSVEKISNNQLLTIDYNDRKRYLIKAGISDVKISGEIANLSQTVNESLAKSRSYSNIGNINIILQNILNETEKDYRLVVTTDKSKVGKIEGNTLYVESDTTTGNIILGKDSDLVMPTGDTQITVKDDADNNATFNVEIVGEETDIGIATITDKKYNFKSFLSNENDYLYFNDVSYEKKLNICNIGTQDLSGVSFSISENNSSEFKSFSHNYDSSAIGFTSGECKEYLVTFQPTKPTTDATYNINIIVKDNYNGISWDDYAPIKVSSYDSNKLYLVSNSKKLNGYVVAPGRELIKVEFSSYNAYYNNNFIRIPKNTSTQYEVILSAVDVSDEDVYMLSTTVEPDTTKMLGFTEVMKNEPDNSIEEATTLSMLYGESISYIGESDIDFYMIQDIPNPVSKVQKLNVSSDIVIKFHTALKQATVTTTNIKVKDSNSLYIDGTVSYNTQTDTVTFSPNIDLTSSETYTIELSAELKTVSEYGDVVSWSFSSTDEPTVIHSDGITFGVITSEITGKVWLDRNLGASRVCTALDDTECYGDYYQWGRDADGHEKFDSERTSTQATSVLNVGHDKFIVSSNTYDYDWANAVDSDGSIRSTSWNPCPTGYKVPDIEELDSEVISNRDDAHDKLKLPSAGYRDYYYSSMSGQGSSGSIWSSSVSGSRSVYLHFNSTNSAGNSYDNRTEGKSVRCIKD